MKDNAMFRKLKKKPKWKIKEERSELQLQQDRIRKETEALQQDLLNLQRDEITAIKANDETSITVIEAQIDVIDGKINRNDARYERNAKVLEMYSKIMKDDGERGTRIVDSLFGAIGIVGGGVLTYFGLKKSFDSDTEGTMVNKKLLDWTNRIPFLRNFGAGRK